MDTVLAGKRIGWIGLGNMGVPMVRHLRLAGAEIAVWNRSIGPVEAAVASGMHGAATPRELGEWVGEGIVCLCLTTPDVVAEVVVGKGGLTAGLGDKGLVIDFGTTGVATTKRLAEKARWIDAPMSGGQIGAEAANLTIMAGGSSADFARAKPILDIVGGRVTHLGPVGSGQVAKLANQLIVAQTIDAVAQALRMGELAGLDSGLLRRALMGGFAESRILDVLGDRMARRDFSPGGKASWQLKDLRLARELADSVGFESETMRNSLAQWETLVDQMGLGELDHSGFYELYAGPER